MSTVDTAVLISAIAALTSAIVVLWKKQEREHEDRKSTLKEYRERLEVCEERTDECNRDKERLWSVINKMGRGGSERKNEENQPDH